MRPKHDEFKRIVGKSVCQEIQRRFYLELVNVNPSQIAFLFNPDLGLGDNFSDFSI
jgi:hypothetical protein